MPRSHWTWTRRHFLAMTAASAGAGLARPRRSLGAGTVRLRLLETSDIHVHVHPYDYYQDKPDDSVGLARIATLVEQARSEVENSLLFDNGDFLQGNPLGDYMAYERGLKAGDLHPIIRSMNELGVDAATLGNHEFNYGLGFLEKALSGASFPLVLANVAKGGGAPGDDRTWLPPYVILEREVIDQDGQRLPLKIGVIGFTPPQIMIWDRAHLEGNVRARDIIETARARVPELREQGADIVIALSHSGIAGGGAEGAENASLFLGAVPDIDAILTGHQHQIFPGETFDGIDGADLGAGRLQGVPAAMPGFWGSHLGLIDLTLARESNEWRVIDAAVENRPIYERMPDRSIKALTTSNVTMIEAVRQEHEATLAYMRRPVGESTAPITSYFALIADDPSVQIVSNAQIWYIAELLRNTEHAGLPVLSAAAPFKSGGRGGPDYYTDVPAGPLAIKNVADIYLYPNTVQAVLIDGAAIKEWLERSAGIFLQIDPAGGDQPLINAAFPAYNFDIIDGVTYQIDVTRPSRYDLDGVLVDPQAERIVDLRYQNEPVDLAAKFIVATNNYRASGGGSFPGLDGSNVVLAAPDTNRDVIVRYIMEQRTINPSADNNWRLAPTTGKARLIFETGTGAERHAEGRSDLVFLARNESGFARFVLNNVS